METLRSEVKVLTAIVLVLCGTIIGADAYDSDWLGIVLTSGVAVVTVLATFRVLKQTR